ncbi:MAG TPA: hypothetical protein VJ346_04035 [Bacteroidales bacterium]|nr:hypothetical protein [Bacteroidales bacterium]
MKIEIYDSQSLNFVELNTTGDNDNHIRCDPESKYLDSIVFNIFVPCFENANKLFDFFGSTKYNSRKIIPLRNELIKNLETFKRASTIEQFITIVSRKLLGKDFLEELAKEDKDWRNNWKGYLSRLIEINKLLIELTEKCAGEERILWVIGY